MTSSTHDRLATIIDEEFGMQEVLTHEDLLTRLEQLFHERRKATRPLPAPPPKDVRDGASAKLINERMTAELRARGVRAWAAADIVALHQVSELRLCATFTPHLSAPWAVWAEPRDNRTIGEGDSIAEALRRHLELAAETPA